MMTVLKVRPFSLRPSGLAESPLFRMGLALRLLVAEPDVLLLDDGLSRVGIIRTMLTPRSGRQAGLSQWNATGDWCGSRGPGGRYEVGRIG